ncbi:MAG: M14 family zinc carboxypeptidase, partial [bacterium]|nr:M14 family zinc carboxypeptidase [bacterium]
APDSGVIQLIALGYSERNERMWDNHHPDDRWQPFYYGTVDGWYWYPVSGSLQDWAYDSTSCIDLTIELDDDKWPDTTRLPQLWEENKDAMIYLIEKTHTGISGVVTDSLTGKPLSAEVKAVEYGKPVLTDPDVGDYYKLLRDGCYAMQFSSPGYMPRTFDSVFVKFDSLTILNVCLCEITGIEEKIVDHLLPVISVYPNPFSTTTAITLSGYQATNAPHSSPFALRIYDLSGRLVKQFTIYDLRFTNHEVVWDGRDKNGVLLPAGVYFYRWEGRGFDIQGKIVMIR